MDPTRTKRTFTTFDPGHRKFCVVAGWNRPRERFYLNLWQCAGNLSQKRFDTVADCETDPAFSDLAFILKEFGLHFPPKWAHTLLSDRPATAVENAPDEMDFGTYHATKPSKDDPPRFE